MTQAEMGGSPQDLHPRRRPRWRHDTTGIQVMGLFEDYQRQRMDLLERFETAVRRQGNTFGERALVALVPWLAFWVAALSADQWIEFRNITLASVPGMAMLTFVMIFLPALAAVCAVPRGIARHVVTVLVSG